MTTRIKMTRSSGNVFLDMGFPPEEAASLSLRAHLMIRLGRAVDTFDDDAKAAKALKVGRRVITDLRRGRIDNFDLDLLFTLLHRAGIEVRVTVDRAPSRRRAA